MVGPGPGSGSGMPSRIPNAPIKANVNLKSLKKSVDVEQDQEGPLNQSATDAAAAATEHTGAAEPRS